MCLANYKDKEKRRQYVRNWHKMNKDKPSVVLNRKRKVEYGRKRRQAKVEWYKEIKKTLFCNRCNFSDHRALQFHHIDPKTKVQQISYMISHSNYSKATILQEIAKCEVLCGNCHLIETYEFQNKTCRKTDFPLTNGLLLKAQVAPTPN